MSDLSPKHEAFINEYLQCFNGTKAYLKVYSDSTEEAARSSASQLLSKQNIQKQINDKISETNKDKIIDFNRIKLKSNIVYLIKLTGFNYYKIGITTNIKSRMASINTSLPFNIEVICTTENIEARDIEKSLHLKYKKFKIKGEWFSLCEYDVNEIIKFFNNNRQKSDVG